MPQAEKIKPQIIRPKPVMLVILDGWGVASDYHGNAVTQARTPNFDEFCKEYFCTTLQASGEAVGLRYKEMGNSEVGHLNIGAGRIIYQNLPKIDKSIIDGDFFKNSVFIKAIEKVNKQNSNLHILGLLSTGGVHASIDHIYALLELANKKQIKNVFLHVILDGRDMNYNSGLGLINDLEKKIKELGVGKIASISGRFWAMDRDNRWQRIEKAYQAMVLGQAENKYKNAQTAVKESYAKKIYDEEFEPAVIINSSGKAITQIKQHDAVIFANYRADRGRQLAKAFVLPGFDKFERDYIEDLYFASMTQYDKDLPIEVAYPPEIIEETLAENIAAAGLRQLHIAETEKYAHVTYFLNGGNENKSQGEDHILIPSPKVDSYSQKPEMSAKEVKDKILKEIQASKYDFIVVNFANPDMVGHTGDLKAGIKAVEYTDRCLGEIIESLIQQDGVAVVIADHGNVEEMINEKTGEIDKEHSSNPVPCLIIGREFKNSEESSTVPRLEFLTPNGILADVAPTILKILNIKKPDEMTGRSLI